MKSPDHVAIREMATEIMIARCGRLARYWAVAAGVTIREKMRRTPVTCTANETATATRSMKTVPRKSIGIPFASATSSSSDAKRSGL